MQNMTFYFQLKLRSELGSNEKFCRRCGTLKRHFTLTKNTTVTLSWARTRTARSGVECTITMRPPGLPLGDNRGSYYETFGELVEALDNTAFY